MEERKDFQITLMLKQGRYVLLSLLFYVSVLVLYPLLQTLPTILQNPGDFWFSIKTWFSLLTPLRWFLYFLYGILFGLTATFFLWQRKEKVCQPDKMIKSGFLGGFGAGLGTILPACPACFSLAGLFLPFSALVILIKYSTLIMTGSVALLFFSLWFLGAFQKRQ